MHQRYDLKTASFCGSTFAVESLWSNSLSCIKIGTSLGSGTGSWDSYSKVNQKNIVRIVEMYTSRFHWFSSNKCCMEEKCTIQTHNSHRNPYFSAAFLCTYVCVSTTWLFASGVLQPWICCFPSDSQMCERISLYSSLFLTQEGRAAGEADLERMLLLLNQLDRAFDDYIILLQIWPETAAYSVWVWLTAGSRGDPRGERLSDGEVGRANAEAGGGIRVSLDRPKKRLNL